MEILTLNPKHTTGRLDIDVVALDDAGVTVSCTAQLTKDLNDIHTVAYDDTALVTEELLAFVRSEVIAYIKANHVAIAAMLK